MIHPRGCCAHVSQAGRAQHVPGLLKSPLFDSVSIVV